MHRNLQTDDQKSTIARTQLQQRRSFMTKKILIVDDDTTMLDLLELFLCGFSCAVTRAMDGDMAIRALRETAFDLVITDLQMGRVSGLDVAGEAKAMYPDMTVFILTGCNDDKTARKAFLLGVNAYLLKPISFRDLVARLKEEGIFLEKRYPAGKIAVASGCFTSC
jgi:YesN/AraC family two-component response regulator